MAKGKYEHWLTEDGLILLRGWARDGLTMAQIAHNMGISRTTLAEWAKKYPDISNAIKKGREVVIYELENALIKKALCGDVAALIFTLKNMKPKKWRDKPDVTAEETIAKLDEVLSRIGGNI